MKELILWLQQPENVAILAGIFLAFATALRVLGELFIAIGKLNPNPDKWDSVGNTFANIAMKFGKLLTYIGIANKQKPIRDSSTIQFTIKYSKRVYMSLTI